MASKVMVKIPAVNFNTQVGKCNPDLKSAPTGSGAINRTSQPPAGPSSAGDTSTVNVVSDPAPRVAQLEQNIRFLKEQHHVMLASLHLEVENLRQRNRDLQFQLIFSQNSGAFEKSTPSSPEDDSKPQILLSPKQVNVTPLQVEILEKDIAELHASLSEARTQNTHLQKIVDDQRKQLENFTKPSVASSTLEEQSNPSSNNPDPELVIKLEETEKLIRRLRRENDEQRRELAMIKAQGSGGGGGGGGLGHYRRGGQGVVVGAHQAQHRDYQHEQHHDLRRDHYRNQREAQHEQHDPHGLGHEGVRLPPLMTQSYWHGGNNGHRQRWNNSWDPNRGAGRARMLNQSLPSLPSVPLTSNPSNGTNSGNPSSSSAPFTLLSHSGGGRRGHRGNFRGERGGGGGRAPNTSAQSGGRGHWDQSREHRGRDRDRQRDQGFDE